MGTALMVGVFLVVQLWRDLRFLGAFVTGLVALLLGLATVNFYVPITPLPPALQSIWLVIHVFVATLGDRVLRRRRRAVDRAAAAVAARGGQDAGLAVPALVPDVGDASRTWRTA